MNKRDGSSPNENLAPMLTMDRNEEGTSSTPAKKPRIESTERIDVAGRVASVKLQNFMCHANLQIDFNTVENNCFYIGGPNGSGKSALFAAINLGLGGRGSDNDRGSTVKSYIKDGTSQAKISIELTNAGLNAHPDFDDLISIERTINQTSSTYVMKSIKMSNHTEKIISKKKSDIDRIISRFNIHLSNPAFWMSQDRSRSFLANFKPSNVYKLYLESTNLENIRLAYVRFAGTLSECRDLVEQKMAEVTLESKRLKRMQEQRELQTKLESDKKELSRYEWKFLFCPVRDFDTQLLINSKKHELHKKLFDENKASYTENRANRGMVEREIQGVCDEVDILKEDVDSEKADFEECSNELMKVQESVKDFEVKIRRKQFDSRAVKKAIDEAEQQLKAAVDKQKNSHIAEKLKKVDADLSQIIKERERMELGDEKKKLKEKFENVSDDYNKKNDEKREAVSHVSKLRGSIQNKKDILRTVNATKQNAINKFGPKMAEIIVEIGKERSHFDKLPKGPIGKYITLTDQKWALAVEQCFYNIANIFLCSSQRDASALRKIFTRLRIPPNEQPSIVVIEFTGICHPNLQEPSSEFQSVYRTLNISDPDVNNAIIDKTSCEETILIEENATAMKVMGSAHAPRNVKKAYTLDGSQAYANGPNSQYRFYRSKGGYAAGLFSTQLNADESKLVADIKRMETEISHIESGSLRQFSKGLIELAQEQKNAKLAIDEFDKKLSQYRAKEIEMGRSKHDLKAALAKAESEDQIATLNDTIDEWKKKIPEIDEELGELRLKLEEVVVLVEPAEKKKKAAEANLEELLGDINKINKKSENLNKKLVTFDEEGEVFKVRLDRLKAEAAILFHEEAKLKCDRDEARESVEARKLVTTMPEGEQDPADLTNFPPTDKAQKLMVELEKRIARAAEGCDQSITLETVKDFKENLKKRRYHCRSLEEALDKLQELHEIRVKSYPSLRQYTEMKVCDKFQELLEVRGHFLGGLEFDHNKQTLNVNVKSCKETDPMAAKTGNEEDEEVKSDQHSESDSEDDEPRKKKAKKQKKKKPCDLKGLSGGERSFVTAALVMSLWEVMEQPFRMMDEFDVFMDMMNRKLVMDLLVELATKKFPHNQFIFFTPQGIKELKKVDGLQVFEMNKVRD